MAKNAQIENFEKLLNTPRDNALLRYSLGNAWLQTGSPDQAVSFLRDAVTADPKFSAAWKLLGKACQAKGDLEAAVNAYQQGICVAESRGDIQAAKEMKVFLKRLEKTPPPQD